jgi:RimJ/RimL family protein N-acetyltransferase
VKFDISPTLNVRDMAAFMRTPDIYWSASDALAPAPENLDLESHLVSPFVFTLTCTYGPTIVGYVQFIQRTSIGGEIHTGFHQSCRGAIAKAFIQHAIGIAFRDKGFLKLWAIIPSDNRPAMILARHIGFEHEGRLTKAIVRRMPDGDGGAPLRDLVLMSISKPAGN